MPRQRFWLFWGSKSGLHSNTKVCNKIVNECIYNTGIGLHFSQTSGWNIPSLPWLLSKDTMTSWICIVVKISVALGGWCDTFQNSSPFFLSIVWSKRGWAAASDVGKKKKVRLFLNCSQPQRAFCHISLLGKVPATLFTSLLSQGLFRTIWCCLMSAEMWK